MSAFLAIDWGTTNRRVRRVEDGAVTAGERDGRGAAAVDDFSAEIAAIRARLGDLPVLAAGMVGSTIGWRAVPYVPAPAGLDAVAAAMVEVAPGVRIVPGLSWREASRGDVMRGEEVQLLGAAAADMIPSDALLCQPGTHCKWATLERGRIARFTTAMTGELFALLRTHGILAGQLQGEVGDDAAFRDGIAEGARGDLAAGLFGIRAAGLLGLREDRDAAAFASGLLIGADVAPRLREAGGAAVHVIGDPALGTLYAAAVDALGGTARIVDGEAAFLAGITHLWELTR